MCACFWFIFLISTTTKFKKRLNNVGAYHPLIIYFIMIFYLLKFASHMAGAHTFNLPLLWSIILLRACRTLWNKEEVNWNILCCTCARRENKLEFIITNCARSCLPNCRWITYFVHRTVSPAPYLTNFPFKSYLYIFKTLHISAVHL